MPNADEFPVLGGSTTPPQVNGHSTHNGPTAAQILQAPAVRKEALKSDAVAEGPEQFRPTPSQVRFAFVYRILCSAPTNASLTAGHQDRGYHTSSGPCTRTFA